MRPLVFILIIIFYALTAKSQFANIDSLNTALKKAEHDSSRSIILSWMARHYMYMNIDTSIQIAQRGLILAQNINFSRGEAACMSRLGQAYSLIGNDAKSLDMLLQALKKAEETSYSLALNTCYNGLAGVYLNHGDIDKALFYDIRASENAPTELSKLVALLNVGDDYEKLNMLDSAKYYTHVAFDMAKKIRDSESEFTALTNLGNIHMKLKQPEVAMANFRMSLDLQRQISSAPIFPETYLGIAKIFMLQNREDSGVYYAKKSFEVAVEQNLLQDLLTAATFLANYYRKKNNIDSAYSYLTYVIETKDSVYSKEKTNQIRNLAFEESMRQKEIEIKTSLAKQERQKNIQYGIIAVTVVSFLIVFFLLSRSIVVNEKWIRFLGVLALLLIFEFINLLIHPWLANITHHSPVLMLLGMVSIAALIIPLHHRIEHWITHKMVAKNKKLRLAAARKIVARLEAEENL